MSTSQLDLNNLDPVEREKKVSLYRSEQLLYLFTGVGSLVMILVVLLLGGFPIGLVIVLLVCFVFMALYSAYLVRRYGHKIQELR